MDILIRKQLIFEVAIKKKKEKTKHNNMLCDNIFSGVFTAF